MMDLGAAVQGMTLELIDLGARSAVIGVFLYCAASTGYAYVQGRRHELGLRDGISGVKYMWRLMLETDIRDIRGSRLDKFMNKYLTT